MENWMRDSLHGRLVFAAAVAMTAAIGFMRDDLRAQTGQTRYELTPAGNEARYRVREQLAGINFPSDAVGATSAISGAIVLDATGKVVPAESKIVVDITGLKSDQERRDGYVRGRTLQAAQFPKVELAVKEAQGLKYPLPPSGELKFQLLGDLTVHGVTKPSIWLVTATPKDGGLAGTATTSFQFAEFGLTKPRVMSVLSVDDLIKLEYTFHLVPKK
jgi:polyisoprenoid-binding protein YceI